MTKTQRELYNSREFWYDRYTDQRFYIISIQNSNYEWDGRKAQLLESANEVLAVITKRLNQLM